MRALTLVDLNAGASSDDYGAGVQYKATQASYGVCFITQTRCSASKKEAEYRVFGRS